MNILKYENMKFGKISTKNQDKSRQIKRSRPLFKNQDKSRQIKRSRLSGHPAQCSYKIVLIKKQECTCLIYLLLYYILW